MALATGLPTGGGVSLAAGGPDNAAQPRILKWFSRATAINTAVDIGPTGWSPGDLYVFSDQLFSATAPYPQIGIVDGRCVLIDPSAFRFDCSFTSKVQDGDILAAGTLTLVEGYTSLFAVVGGTSAYRNARGEVSLLLGPIVGPHQLTVSLILTP